jgi:two-component system, chemotaxis family, sensor kinase Cph1
LPVNIKERLKNKISVNYEIEYDFNRVKYKEFYKTSKNNIAYLQEVITPLLDRDRKINGYLFQVQDITNRKNTELSLKKAVTDLESSNKELEKFAYVASHDLQEPLRMIGSFTQLLAKRYKGKLDKDADEFISYAVEGANRMHQLINDLLTYSRLTTRMNSFIPIDCNIVVEKVILNLKTIINEYDAQIKFDHLPVIYGDESQIIQLFQNLINNAIKFYKEGKPEIFISCLSMEKEWQFSVHDNGIGIDPTYHERIFIIFQRLNSRNNYLGTGIGLAICKKIVELHGGRIWVESQLNEGSTFYFTILKTKGFKND